MSLQIKLNSRVPVEGVSMRQRVSLQLCLAFAATLAVAPLASASSITLYPGSIPTSNVVGDATNAAPGFASGSWQADATTAGAKTELYIPVNLLFTGPVLLGDIESITYWTNKPGTAGDPDWTLLLYTAPTHTADDSASWYQSRLNSEPYFTQTAGVAANTWHEWSTADPTNPLTFFDQPRSGNFGTYGDPTLADLQAGPVTWGNSATRDYGSEALSLFSLQTGSGWADGFTGLVDGLTITLRNGEVGTVNLEAAPTPAPEPASLVLLGTGLFGVAARWRKRRS
jgi:hypothetical protein